MKFSLAIDKMKAADVGRAAGHNCRLHPTASQLPQGSWFTDKGRHEVVAWRHDVIAKARGLSKRKDAVVAISFVLQVGNQLDWREKETPDCPEGRPRGGRNSKSAMTVMGNLAKAAKEWAIKEFGEENVVGVDLHTDESSPHVHVVVTPVLDGKLQAKAWLDGAARCAQLRRRAFEVVSGSIECEYTAGSKNGGAKHDPEQAAGRIGRIARRDRALNEREANLNEREEALFEREAEIAEREVALYQREQILKKRESDLDALAEQVAASTPAELKSRNKRLSALLNELPESLIRELDKDLRQSIRTEQSSKNKDGYERN